MIIKGLSTEQGCHLTWLSRYYHMVITTCWSESCDLHQRGNANTRGPHSHLLSVPTHTHHTHITSHHITSHHITSHHKRENNDYQSDTHTVSLSYNTLIHIHRYNEVCISMIYIYTPQDAVSLGVIHIVF